MGLPEVYAIPKLPVILTVSALFNVRVVEYRARLLVSVTVVSVLSGIAFAELRHTILIRGDALVVLPLTI